MSYHVQRNGKIIGDYDERTLIALLNAGTLRATDTYRSQSMPQWAPLANLLGTESGRRAKVIGVLLAILGLGLAAAVVGVSSAPRNQPRMMEAGGHRPGLVEEVHRGYPVLRASLSASNHLSPPTFPFQAVDGKASHGRVAVLALDGKDGPQHFGSGFVTEDGRHVVTALSVVKGASVVEIWYGGQRQERAAGVIVDAEAGLAVLVITAPETGLPWSSTAPAEGVELFCASHALVPLPALATVQTSLPQERHVFYKLDRPLAASFLGSAALNAAGEVCAIVTQPETGTLLRGADIRQLLDHHPAVAVSTLASLSADATPSPVVVDSAGLEGGELVVQLRNTGSSTVNHALLHVRYHDLPPEAGETASLERQMAATAMEVSTLEFDAPSSDQYFQKKQELREITARLEAQRQLVATALAPARQRIYRTEVLVVDATLAPGIPQRLTIDTEAASNWGASVTVLDAME